MSRSYLNLHFIYLFFDGSRGHQAVHNHIFGLPNSISTIHGLIVRTVKRRVCKATKN